MTHNFDIEIAAKYGVNEAILLNNIYYWVEHNRANDKNFYDGHYWVYNSAKAFNELFPYMTIKQITYALKKLKNKDLFLLAIIITLPMIVLLGTLLQRTVMPFAKMGKCICQKWKMHLTKRKNPFAKMGKWIRQKGIIEIAKRANQYQI